MHNKSTDRFSKKNSPDYSRQPTKLGESGTEDIAKMSASRGSCDIDSGNTEAWTGNDLLDQVAKRGRTTESGDLLNAEQVLDKRNLPKSIGRYPIKKWIGQGASGSVYLAEHPGLKRDVAIKVMNFRLSEAKESSVKKFLQEALITDQLNHPNIIRVYDVGEDKMMGFYIVMEYAEGGDLGTYIHKNGPADITFALGLMKGIASALVEAERAKIIHRDIKPQNMMLTKNYQIKLADLGLAKYTDVENDMSLSLQPKGTPIYMAPEQVRDSKHVDIRADIYSLGASFYELVTGKRPFDGKDFYEIWDKKRKECAFKKPAEMNHRLDENISKIICKMMAYNPEDRYQSPSELLKELEDYQPAPAVVPKKLFSKIFLYFSGFAMVAFITLLIFADQFFLWKMKPKLGWNQMVYQLASKVELKQVSLQNRELTIHHAKKKKQINILLQQARNSLEQKELKAASTLYLDIIRSLQELKDSIHAESECIQLQNQLQELRKSINVLSPDMISLSGWTRAQTLQRDAEITFESKQFGDALEMYQDALARFQYIWNSLYQKDLKQKKQKVKDLLEKIEGLEVSKIKIDPKLWRDAENQKKSSQLLEKDQSQKISVLRAWQDTISQFERILEKAHAFRQAKASADHFQNERSKLDSSWAQTYHKTVWTRLVNTENEAKLYMKNGNFQQATGLWQNAVSLVLILREQISQAAREKDKFNEVKPMQAQPLSVNNQSVSFPTSTVGGISAEALHENLQVAQDIAKIIPNRKIAIAVRSNDGKQIYKDGESLSLNVRPDKNCYLAVLAHYIDGQSVLLFPNEYNSGNFVVANSSVDIPGENNQNFELFIHEPFGTDIIQVIACNDSAQLHSFLDKTFKNKKKIPIMPLVSVKHNDIKRELPNVKRAISYRPKHSQKDETEGKNIAMEWGEVQFLVYTAPK